MNSKSIFPIATALRLACCFWIMLAAAAEPLSLWYREPATKWVEALPVGNGRLGAMVFGGVEAEQIQFNESTLWTGKPHQYHHEGAAQYLPQLRQLLQEGKQKEAETLALEHFMSVPLRQKAYQPFGDLRLRFRAKSTTAQPSHTRWVIANWQGRLIGLAVDRVTEVFTLNEAEARPVPDLGYGQEVHGITAAYSYGGRLVFTLDIERITQTGDGPMGLGALPAGAEGT